MPLPESTKNPSDFSSDSAALGHIRDRLLEEENNRRYHSMERNGGNGGKDAKAAYNRQASDHGEIRIVVDHADRPQQNRGEDKLFPTSFPGCPGLDKKN